jgi:hypothetical protein
MYKAHILVMLHVNLLGHTVTHFQIVQVPGVTPSAGLSGGSFNLVMAHLGLTGPEILNFWHKINQATASMPQAQTNAIGEVGKATRQTEQHLNGILQRLL